MNQQSQGAFYYYCYF